MEKLVEIGINLMNRAYNHDREEVIKRAIDSNVTKMIITGTNKKSSEEAEKYAQKHKGILYSTAGIHPHDAKNWNLDTRHKLEELLKKDHVVAVGECGLDFNRDFSPRDVQEACFKEQLELARISGKPLFLHERDAHSDFVRIMNENKDLITRSVVHCFTGTAKEVQEYIKMGFYIGVTGWICDERRGLNLREAVKHIPLDRLLVETDGPYLTPRNLKEKPKDSRNEPCFLPHVVENIAHCMGKTYEEVARQTTKNAEIFFQLN